MLALAICPVLLGLLPAHALLWGWRVAGAHLVFGLVLSALLVELLLLNFDKIPFTCTYLPGKANVKGFWPVYRRRIGCTLTTWRKSSTDCSTVPQVLHCSY